MIEPDRVLYNDQIELFDYLNYEQINNLREIELFEPLTACKQMTDV